MRNRRLPRGLAVMSFLMAVLGAGRPAFAQDTPKVEISGGYQLLRVETGEGESYPVGWYADAVGNITRNVGLVFQVGGNYKTYDESFSEGSSSFQMTAHVRIHEFMGGARFSAHPNDKVTPFGQFLFGVIHYGGDASSVMRFEGQTVMESHEKGDSASDAAMQVGGGVNFMLTRTFGIRAGADYLRMFSEEEGVDLFRVGAGVVFAF